MRECNLQRLPFQTPFLALITTPLEAIEATKTRFTGAGKNKGEFRIS